MKRMMVWTAVCAAGAQSAGAAPVEAPWAVEGPDDSSAVAAAALSGWYAVADSFEDSVEVRDVRQTLLRTITRAEIEAFAPWMSLDGSPDGPTALAWTDSGRSLFIVVFDDTVPGDGLGSDVVLRYDTPTDTLSLFARAEVSAQSSGWPHLSAVHYRGRLYVGGESSGVMVFSAGRNDTTGTPIGAHALPGAPPVLGLAVDREDELLFAASGSDVYRADVNDPSLAWTLVGSVPSIRAITYSDSYGTTGNPGMYVLSEPASGTFFVQFVPRLQATGSLSFGPSVYTLRSVETHDIAATAGGRLLLAEDEDATVLSDSDDPRMDFETWLTDEFQQVVLYGRGLIAPDGEPDGWVIDGDVTPGGTRFHPATPDGACWTTLLLLMNDHLFGDATAQERVRTVLKRYAGQMGDGYAPGISTDGHIRHWCDPFSTTGAAKSGWSSEYATLSTMKIVLAAARASAYYPGDSEIQGAAEEIITRVPSVAGWDTYIQSGTDSLYFISQGSSPDPGAIGAAYHEGIIFMNEAAAYGTSYSQSAYSDWLNRSLWPTATYVSGMPITGNSPGGFQAAFLSLYPLLAMSDYRNSPAWQEQVRNLLASNSAWTDDNAPRFMTVFSAGTTKSIWGGYNADSLGYHPGDITTFPSLEAFCATGSTAPAVSAYNAYRRGAREAWDTGAEFLYRRSDVDPSYNPNANGLPDVALGALGLAELIQPGSVEAVLTGAFPTFGCVADVTTQGAGPNDPGYGVPDGLATAADLNFFVNFWIIGAASTADITTQGAGEGDPGYGVPDGQVTAADLNYFVNAWIAGCP